MNLPETKILEAILELNKRMLVMQKPEQRAILRGLIENLRRELVSLVESFHVYSDDEYSAVPNGQRLRDSIENLRREILSAVWSIQIYTEDDVRFAHSGQRWLA